MGSFMKWVLSAAGVVGFLSVLSGAMKDHLLGSNFSEQDIIRWQVALNYHQLYSIVLLVLGLYILLAFPRSKLFSLAVYGFLLGVLTFSGSLYLSTLLKLEFLTYLTPIGGILIMAGWINLTAYAFTVTRQDRLPY